jgi:hypothetical protein
MTNEGNEILGQTASIKLDDDEMLGELEILEQVNDNECRQIATDLFDSIIICRK